MEYNDFIEYYKNKHESKIFRTKLSNLDNCYILYTYEKNSELENFKTTFLYYFPFYVRSSDALASINLVDADEQLKNRSLHIKRHSYVVPKRQIKNNGLYGELFLDFYLRVVCKRNTFITYSQRREFGSNAESKGIDNVVYFVDNDINICFSEAKFVGGAFNAKNELVEDISGNDKKIGHLTKDYLNSYIKFIIEKNDGRLFGSDKFKKFLETLNSKLDISEEFINILKDENVCFNFVYFAIFKSTKEEIKKLNSYYDCIKDEATKKIKELGIEKYNIEIVFIPTKNQSMKIKEEIESSYE